VPAGRRQRAQARDQQQRDDSYLDHS
jgi:hypothetical protein